MREEGRFGSRNSRPIHLLLFFLDSSLCIAIKFASILICFRRYSARNGFSAIQEKKRISSLEFQTQTFTCSSPFLTTQSKSDQGKSNTKESFFFSCPQCGKNTLLSRALATESNFTVFNQTFRYFNLWLLFVITNTICCTELYSKLS